MNATSLPQVAFVIFDVVPPQKGKKRLLEGDLAVMSGAHSLVANLTWVTRWVKVWVIWASVVPSGLGIGEGGRFPRAYAAGLRPYARFAGWMPVEHLGPVKGSAPAILVGVGHSV